MNFSVGHGNTIASKQCFLLYSAEQLLLRLQVDAKSYLKLSLDRVSRADESTIVFSPVRERPVHSDDN